MAVRLVCLAHGRAGKRFGCLGILQDITERRQAEEAQNDSEEQYRNLLENHVDGVAVIVEGRFHYVNERCYKIGGYTREDLLGRPILEFVAAEDRLYAIERMAAIIKGEESIPHVYTYIRKDGTTVPVEVAGQRISFDGKPAILSVFRDVTQRKRLEEEARQHREELAHVLRVSTMGEMATGLAHELNQPLTAIGIFAAACRTTLCSNPTMDESEKLISILKKIEAQSQRAGRVIDRIRNLVRKRDQDCSSFHVNLPIRNVISLVEQETRINSVVVNLELDETIQEVVGDSIQIEQVILNLVRNGIEAIVSCYNGDQREMTLRTSQLQTGKIEVSISDTGPGIFEETRDRIFEAFVSTKQKGLGMGLAISRTIVESHGGSLSFTPNSDYGSTFQFTLPTFLESSS
jgi:PAS domain S-box-containing protein